LAKIAFIFPGQGSQSVGMGKDFYQNFAGARETFDQGNEILGFNIKEMIFNGSKEDLQDTANTQPALLLTSIAILKVFSEAAIDRGLRGFNNGNSYPVACAGHSLGEFTAYVASHALSFRDGLLTVRKRGELMAGADPKKKGAMAAIIGLNDSEVEEICKEVSKIGVIVPANYNCPGQIVISGERSAVEKGIELAKLKKAKMAVILDVSGAFHSPLIKDASIEFEKFLSSIDINKPLYPVISNVTADIIDYNNIKSSWVKQMLSSVLWKKSVEKMIDMGVDIFIEVGAGKVLQGLVKKINKDVTVLGIDSLSTLEKTLEQLK